MNKEDKSKENFNGNKDSDDVFIAITEKRPNLEINLKQLIDDNVKKTVFSKESVLTSINFNEWPRTKVGLLWGVAESPKILNELIIKNFKADLSNSVYSNSTIRRNV